eukprot:1569850-Pyramimonas_sp.AAC.1
MPVADSNAWRGLRNAGCEQACPWHVHGPVGLQGHAIMLQSPQPRGGAGHSRAKQGKTVALNEDFHHQQFKHVKGHAMSNGVVDGVRSDCERSGNATAYALAGRGAAHNRPGDERVNCACGSGRVHILLLQYLGSFQTWLYDVSAEGSDSFPREEDGGKVHSQPARPTMAGQGSLTKIRLEDELDGFSEPRKVANHSSV